MSRTNIDNPAGPDLGSQAEVWTLDLVVGGVWTWLPGSWGVLDLPADKTISNNNRVEEGLVFVLSVRGNHCGQSFEVFHPVRV